MTPRTLKTAPTPTTVEAPATTPALGRSVGDGVSVTSAGVVVVLVLPVLPVVVPALGAWARPLSQIQSVSEEQTAFRQTPFTQESPFTQSLFEVQYALHPACWRVVGQLQSETVGQLGFRQIPLEHTFPDPH